MVNNEKMKEYAKHILKENPIILTKLKKLPIDESIDSIQLLVEVVKFLYLVKVFEVKLTPSLVVDLGWHEFILFTKAYDKFCKKELGKFIHHTPEENKVTNNKNYLKTIQHYMNLFGKPPIKIWGEVAESEWENSQCGSCESN